MAENRALDRASVTLFRTVLQCYEQKDYKKGVRNADMILKKYPAHGETLAMKGLILTNLNQRDEGWELVRKGLRNDIKSHVCWHVYGLLYRAEHNYEEAIKCYHNALRFDPDQIVIQRDLANLQSQLRLYPGLVDTRRQLLKRNIDDRAAWTALAVAHYLNGDHAAADKTLREYEDEKLAIRPKNKNDHSMTVLFHNLAIAESGDTARALDHLDSVDWQVLDKLEVAERRAKYCLQLARHDEAQRQYRHLLDINPDCYRYFAGYERAKQVVGEGGEIKDEAKLNALYDELQQAYPRSTAAKRLPLNWLSGDKFEAATDRYLRMRLQKGVPSTFVDLKALYADEDKARTIEQLAEGYLAKLESDDAALTLPNGDASPKKDAPTSYLWTLYFLAQHFDYRRELDKAMTYIDRAIAHTPTLVELHMTKARILKHTGSARLAAEQINVARELDLQDRFINTKCTKYHLRADQNGEAAATISLFVNTTLGGGAIGDLTEMQSLNFLIEDADSWSRQGLLGIALRRYTQVRRAYEIWKEDQFDFHAYCFRKATVCAYVDMLRWADGLFATRQYRRCARGAVLAYLRIHDTPEYRQGPHDESIDDAGRKREKKRVAKIRARVAKDATKEPEKKESGDMARKTEADPLGDALLTASDETQLADAIAFLTPWLKTTPDDEEALSFLFDVQIRQKAYDDALATLRKLQSAHLSHSRSMQLRKALTEEQADSLKALDEAFFATGAPDAAWNDSFLTSMTAPSIDHVDEYLAAARELKTGISGAALVIVLDVLRQRAVSPDRARAVLAAAQKIDPARAEQIDKAIRARWTNAFHDTTKDA